MEPFVTRIGDVTIERVVPRTGKEQKESIPAPSVSLAKRVPGGGENESDTINVSEDLQIFLKPPAGDGKENSKKTETLSGKGEPESVDSVKSGGDPAKMSTDEEGCDEDSESEDLRREEIDKTESDVITKNGGDSLHSFRTDGKNDEEDSEVGTEELAEDKVSESKERQSEVVEDSAVCKTEEGCDNSAGDNSGEKAESNKRKASLEGSNNAGGSQKKKKKRRRRKTRSSEKEALTDSSGEPSASSSSESDDGEEEQTKPSVERKVSNLRRNIREVMNESQLDEETLAAQRQEMERLRRVQEQQRIIREVQRQIALNKQNTKTQTRVISLLQGNSSILKQIPGTSSSSSSTSTTSGGTQVRLPNTVLVKLASGSASNNSTQTKKVYELLRVQKGAGRGSSPSGRAGQVRAVPGKSRSPGQVHMMTPSVSIAPVMSAQSSQQGSDSESDLGDGSDKEVSSSGGMKTIGKPKGKDVVTISSSSDDDDCILLSEPSSGDEGDPVDDPTNSGMHTNDLYNVPDDQGRVLVNVGHPPEEPDIFLGPQIARVIKPHQIGGVRFLYDNVVESVERFNTSTGFGCILAHSMGLGKTLQVVSFCDVFLRHTKARTVLCIMPINTLQNWLAEFNMWLPEKDPQNSPLAVHGEVRPREFPLHVLNDSHKTMTARSKVIQEWNKDGGVLLIGYELYRQLSLRRAHKSKKKRKKMLEVVDVDEEDKNKLLLDEIHGALVKPGPDLVICDEGHRIKNSHASISQALKQIRSKRRVVLTGYPLQNNLLEYWCMVDFVRPNYLGTKTEFCNMFERPIQNGQCIDSTPQDIRLMRYRAHVLHSLLEGFVQRRSHSVLQVSLPQKEEYVLLLRMTAFQRKLYDTFMNEVVRTKAVPNPLKAFAVCCKIWNHPDVLYYFLKKRNLGDDVDLDLEETTAASTPMTPRGNGASPAAPKRGRGRTPRSSGGSKRDKKGGQTGSGRKPAATIIPNNTNLNVESSGMPMPGGMGGIGHNPHGMSNMGAPQQMQPSLPHQQNQGFNTLAHQNQSYNRDTAPYDMYHQNIPQGSGSSYGNHGYSGSGYAQSNSSSNFGGMETHNYGDGHHTTYGDCSSGGSYYQSTNVRDQGSYNPYYGNSQQVNNENNFQCNTNNSNYWHTNHSSYYQQNVHSDSTNAGSRTNQYYGNNTGQHYGSADQSYYLNHQQNQNQNFAGQINGNMYHSMGTDSYGNNMGHMHGARSQQTQLEEQSDQRLRNSQSLLGAQTHSLGSVSTHMGTGHGQMSNCQSNIQGQNMTPNQNMSGQAMTNQSMQNQNLQSQNQGIQSQSMHNAGQNLHNQGMQNQVMQSQNLSNQGMQGQNLSNTGMQSQNLPNQGMQGQNLPNQGMQGQNLTNQGMQGQNLPNQGLQGQNLPNQGMQGQNLPNQGMQGQNMQNQGMQSQNMQNQGIQGQNIQNQGMQGQNIQNQGMQGQNLPNQGMQGQNLSNQGIQGQNLPNQGMQGQNLPNQGMQGQSMQSQGMQGQNLQNQGMQSQNLQNQGMQSQNLQSQNLQTQAMQGQNLQTQGMQGQNLQTQGMQGQNLQSQGMQGQNLQNQGVQSQTISNQNLQGPSISNQGMHGQNIPNQNLHTQNIQNQNMQGSNMATQVLQAQNLAGPGMQGQSMSSQGMQGQNMSSQGMQSQGLPSSKQTVLSGRMSSQQNLENQNMQGQLSTNHNQIGNTNHLGKSPNSNSNHCGNQLPGGGQLSNVQSGIDKMSQLCGSPTQSRSGMPPNSSPLSSQKAVISGSHGTASSSASNVTEGNMQPMINSMHSQLDSMGAMQSSGHMSQGLNDMQNHMGMSVQYHNSAGTAEISNSQQAWHYGHQGIQGDNRNSCGSYDTMEQTYTNSSRLCDVKPDVRKMPPAHGDPLCEMGSMYNRFPTKDEKQDNSEQWTANEMPTEQNVLNAAVKCDPADNFENGSEVKSTVKSESSCSMSVRALSPQDSSQSQSMITSPNKNLSEDSSSLNDKSEIDKDCEPSQLVGQCGSPPSKSAFGAGASQPDVKGTENVGEANTCLDLNQEGKEQKADVKGQMTDVPCLSPNSERCEEKSKDLDLLPEDTKGLEMDPSGKNVGSGTDTGEEGSKECNMTDKNVSDVKHCIDPQMNVGKICTKEDPGIPYDWATELLKNYVPGSIENSAKMEVFFCILEESMALGDRMLVFSQSLFTLNLIEDFLQRSNLPGRQEKWSRNWNYYRLDGSTSALEREKLINEYNSNPNIHLFLVSTRAGSLGINLVGANRVVVFDASWNPCHDTQAVCRVYRYGQKKPCFVYRLVMDNCLEKKIYDRQINKQGMADRVVDECNPDAHLSIKEVTNLCWDNEEETEVRDFSKEKHKYIDVVMQKVLDKYSALLTKEPFQHESLLVDRKEKKLSQAEKRLAKRSYELEKQANINYNRPQYSYYPSTGVCNSGMQTSLQIRAIRTDGTGNNMVPKPVASVRPMQAELNSQVDRTLRTSGALNSSRSRWIPADVWQRQGMSAQEMTLPLDVVIPTNSPDRASIVLKAGQRVMVLKSPKGIYMQLENGKIIAIRTAFKVGGSNKGGSAQDYKNTLTSNIDKSDLEMKPVDVKKEGGTPNSNRSNVKVNSVLPLKNNSAITIIPKISPASNVNRSGGNANKSPVNKITPINIKQEPNCRSNWGSNGNKQSHTKENKSRVEAKPYFQGQNQNQNQRNSVDEEFEDNDSNDQPQSSSSKPFYTQESESKGGSNTHSSFSDDGSSGVTNLMMDDKENSNLTEGETMIKSPSPQNYPSVNRKEEGEQISETSHENSPKDSERENQNFPQGSGQNTTQTDENSWPQSDKSNASYEANKNQKGSSQNEDFQNYPRHTELSQQNSGTHPPSHSVTPVSHQAAHHSLHPSSYQDEFRQMHDDTDGHQETPISAQPLQQQEYTDGARETSKQDMNITSFAHKNVCHLTPTSNSSDSSSVSQNHSHFIQEHHKSMISGDQSASNSKMREDETASCGSQPVSQSHSYTESAMKSPANYHNTLENAGNSYTGYKHESSNPSSSSMMDPNKNIRPYHETNMPSVAGDLHNVGRGKCELHKLENCECDGSRNNTKMKMSEVSPKSNASSQSYLPPPSSHAQSNPQIPSETLTPSKKRQSSKSVTSGSETMTSDCTSRYSMENAHMKSYINSSSSLESQHSTHASQPVPLSSATFPTPSNVASENYQMPLHNPHVSTANTHSTDYSHVGNLKSLPQPPTTENVYGSSYSQYLGGPAYYGFGQQTTPSMMQFGNHYYSDNQYERSLTSSDQSQNKERNASHIPHSIGRSDAHTVSTSLTPNKKEANQLSSGDSRELKQDSKSSLCVREDVRPSGSPGSASGSHSNNNSARSTPAINQTPVSSSSTEPASNCNPSLPSALPSVPPANFNPYASGASSSTASLSAHQNPYESMMLNSYTPGTCQYNIPGSSAASTTGPFATPGTNYGSPLRPTGPSSTVSPYGGPTAYGGTMTYGGGVSSQYESDYARASMYSAFHRPEPHHFAAAPAELAPPFLPSVAPPTNPSPFTLSSHHRTPHFPSSPGASSQNSNYYPQNMYAPSPYPTRPGYTATDTAYGVPYGTPTPTFSPFLNHHLHQHPYSTLQHPGSAAPPGPQSTGASPAP